MERAGKEEVEAREDHGRNHIDHADHRDLEDAARHDRRLRVPDDGRVERVVGLLAELLERIEYRARTGGDRGRNVEQTHHADFESVECPLRRNGGVGIDRLVHGGGRWSRHRCRGDAESLERSVRRQRGEEHPGSCSVVVTPVVTVCASSGQMMEQ